MRALIVEDDPSYGAHLARILTRDGFVADWEPDAALALEKGYDAGYAAIILDLMLSAADPAAPGGLKPVDGFSLLRRWRKRGVRTPVLVLTASRTDLEDTTASYELDADYEIKRPGAEFDALLLAWARSRSARREQAPQAAPSPARRGALEVDFDLREARLSGKSVDLSQTEFNVLVRLLKADGGWVSVDQIAGAAFGPNCETPTAQVYEYVKRLRQKLGFGLIRNQRGRGYRLAVDDAAGSAGDHHAP